MNQIFKVVYSAAKQCYVVTSEFAKSNGKKASIVAAALVLTSAVGAVNAADTMESRVSTLESRLEAAIAKENADVAALTTIVKNTSDAQVATNKQKSEANETAINELKPKVEANTEAVGKIDEKIGTAKTELETKIGTAKTEAITEAGTKADEKVTAAKTELTGKIDTAKAALETKFEGLDKTTVKLEKYDKDIVALQAADKAHEARLTTVEQDVKTVGANAAALAALKPLQYNPGQTTQVMAGVGTYRGKTAVALGAAHYASENLMYHAGVSFGNGNGAMANAGVTIGFGSGEGAKANSSKVAELQSAVDRLTAENEQVKAALYDIYAKLQAK